MPKCETCGLLYSEADAADRRYHAKKHDLFINGPKVKVASGVHLVRPASPLHLRRAAEDAAHIFQWEMKYDVRAYSATDHRSFRKHKSLAVVYVAANRVVGLLVERDWHCRFQVRLSTEKVEERTETICRRVDIVWVLESQRRQGIGKALLTDFVSRLADRPLAVQLPISQDGRALVRSFGIDQFWTG